MPVVVDLAPTEAMRLLAQAETLGRLGLEIEAFGPGAVLVRAVPAALKNPDAAGLLRDLAEEFAEDRRAGGPGSETGCRSGPPGLPPLHPRRAAADRARR